VSYFFPESTSHPLKKSQIEPALKLQGLNRNEIHFADVRQTKLRIRLPKHFTAWHSPRSQSRTSAKTSPNVSKLRMIPIPAVKRRLPQSETLNRLKTYTLNLPSGDTHGYSIGMPTLPGKIGSGHAMADPAFSPFPPH
jgi:hypothetical protein